MKYRLVAGMATMPSREHSARRALRSLLGQFDKIHLVLNGYTETPEWAIAPEVNVTLSGKKRDYGAAGKLLGLSEEPDITQILYFCVDDDYRYPRNFARRLSDFLQRHEMAMVGVHGSKITRPFSSWRDDRKVFSARKSLLRSRQVDVIATCGCAFRPSELRFDPRQWPDEYRNCVDLHLATLAAQQRLTRWVIAHYRGWMRPIERKQEDSIYSQLLIDDSVHVSLALELLKLER